MNAVDTVAAVRRAQAVTHGWPNRTMDAVVQAMPEVCRDCAVDPLDWCITVELLHRDWETPEMAAQRIALYMQLHAERWDDTPTLATIRTNHLEER